MASLRTISLAFSMNFKYVVFTFSKAIQNSIFAIELNNQNINQGKVYDSNNVKLEFVLHCEYSCNQELENIEIETMFKSI